MRRFAVQEPLGFAGAILICAAGLTALLAPWLAPYDPTSTEFNVLQAPNSVNWFGTDARGRDILSRVIFGSRTSLEVGVAATAFGISAGAFIGLLSGYLGGLFDMVLQRVVDGVMAFPALIVALVMVSVFGSSLTNLVLVIGFAFAPGVSRVIRGVTLSEREAMYVEAARSAGASPWRVMLRHILPNLLAPITVIATSALGSVILVEAGLSFLGFGTPPPTPSWGADLSRDARQFFLHAPWMAIFPGAAISLVVLAFNLLGDSVRDQLDPRLRHGR